ncbi:MAG: hypothetical protein K2K91_01210 [Ruminococcus sp.]|nr:hypothetical protein [Ruminococcus sp.]MDE7097925.1 hypothetical protein [Ruminococcus sp.]
MTRKKIGIIAVLAVLIIMLIPIKSQYKDGGTVKYNAVLYGITKHHAIYSERNSPSGKVGYNIGTTVRILWFDVYDNVKFVLMENIERQDDK